MNPYGLQFVAGVVLICCGVSFALGAVNEAREIKRGPYEILVTYSFSTGEKTYGAYIDHTANPARFAKKSAARNVEALLKAQLGNEIDEDFVSFATQVRATDDAGRMAAGIPSLHVWANMPDAQRDAVKSNAEAGYKYVGEIKR